MDSFISNPKSETKTISIILPTENEFSIKLKNALGRNYKIIKSRDKYNLIDFMILNKVNIKHIYLEYKRRNGNNRKYSSVIINECKIRAIKQNYNRCLFVFEYDNSLDFIKYDNEVFSNLNGSFVKNQDVRQIPNHLLIESFDKLIEFLKSELK
jgi:hypothetical protein